MWFSNIDRMRNNEGKKNSVFDFQNGQKEKTNKSNQIKYRLLLTPPESLPLFLWIPPVVMEIEPCTHVHTHRPNHSHTHTNHFSYFYASRWTWKKGAAHIDDFKKWSPESLRHVKTKHNCQLPNKNTDTVKLIWTNILKNYKIKDGKRNGHI